MYVVVLVIVFTLIFLTVIVFVSRFKRKHKRKEKEHDVTFLIGKPKGPNKQKESETCNKDIQTEPVIIESQTGPRGEKGIPGLPFQLNDCGNLTDGLLQELATNITTPFYYYAVSKDLRTYRTDLEHDVTSHLICYVSKNQQWFDLGMFSSFTTPPTFLNVRSYETDGSSFQVPDHSYYLKYQLWKDQNYIEGVIDVHPGQIIQMRISSNIVDFITPTRNPQNSVSYSAIGNTPRIVLWY